MLTGLSSAYKGVALIISNSYTRDYSNDNSLLQPLDNSHTSASKLKEAFKHLKFFTIVEYNVTKSELMSLLASFRDCAYLQPNHQFVFAFFGYGENDIVYCEDENNISASEIIASVSSDVPRLFFFDVSHSGGLIMNEKNKKWQHKIADAENVLVAFVTTMENKTSVNSLWTSLLAKKLITCDEDIFDVVMGVNEELIEMDTEDVQQTELISTLDTTIIML